MFLHFGKRCVCVIPLDMIFFFFVDLCISILYAVDTSAETCFWFYQPCRERVVSEEKTDEEMRKENAY